MNKLLATLISIALAIALLILAVTMDREIGRDRLAELSTLPDYTPSVSQDITQNESEEKEGDDAPNFTVTDAQGGTMTLEQLRGKPVILHFWASWAGSNTRELDMFQRAYDQYKDTVHFVIVNTTSDSRETREKADAVLSERGYTFPAYYDLDASAANGYSVIQLPTTFFIDANGRAVAYAASEINRGNLDLGLQYCEESAARAEKATEPAETTTPTESTESTEATTAA